MQPSAIHAVALALLCGSCSYHTDIAAGVVNGRLAFTSLDDDYDCVANINVSTDEDHKATAAPGDWVGLVRNGGAYWWTSSPGAECTTRFPVIYGELADRTPPSVSAKPLRMGVVYEVMTQGQGAYGSGRFRINSDRRVENLPLSWERKEDAVARLQRIQRKFGTRR